MFESNWSTAYYHSLAPKGLTLLPNYPTAPTNANKSIPIIIQIIINSWSYYILAWKLWLHAMDWNSKLAICQVAHLCQLRHQRPEAPINACLGSCFSAARLHPLAQNNCRSCRYPGYPGWKNMFFMYLVYLLISVHIFASNTDTSLLWTWYSAKCQCTYWIL